jgi:hypothetical protein
VRASPSTRPPAYSFYHLARAPASRGFLVAGEHRGPFPQRTDGRFLNGLNTALHAPHAPFRPRSFRIPLSIHSILNTSPVESIARASAASTAPRQHPRFQSYQGYGPDDLPLPLDRRRTLAPLRTQKTRPQTSSSRCALPVHRRRSSSTTTTTRSTSPTPPSRKPSASTPTSRSSS